MISVIIPTYNRADLLKEAVQSVLDQTYQDFEIIVVDDGSSEDIAGVVAAVDNPVIRYERLERGGVSKARNHGVRVAHGKYVAFLDSDDLFLPRKLEAQVALFESQPELGMVYTAYTAVDERKKPISEHAAPVYPDGYKQMLTACTIATPTVMVRRDVFERVGMFDESMHLAEDIDLWCRIFKDYPIAPVHEPLTMVRLHNGGTTRDPEAVLNAYMVLLIKAFKADPTIKWIDKRRMLARMHYICASDVYALVDPFSTDPHKYQTYYYYYAKAARYYPFSRTGIRVLFNHYTRGIRSFAHRVRNFVTGNRLRRKIESLRYLLTTAEADLAATKADLTYVIAELKAAKEQLSEQGKTFEPRRGEFTEDDLERAAAWMSANLPGNEAHPIFHKYGFHVLRQHYYLPIPEADEIVHAAAPSHMIGIDINAARSFDFLERVVAPYKSEFNTFPLRADDQTDETQFYLLNGAYMAIDGNVYYGMIRHFQPRRIIEIGSGFSTLLAAHAIRKNIQEGGSATQITCIEPYPRPMLYALDSFVTVNETIVQGIPLETFTSLGENDILFIDSSHVLRMGNDVWYEYCEILPRLNAGVLIHVHDISLPKPYPQVYFERHLYWNEQYLLQAMLAHNPRYEILWAGNRLMCDHPERMRAAFAPEYDHMRGEFSSSEPSSFWMRVK